VMRGFSFFAASGRSWRSLVVVRLRLNSWIFPPSKTAKSVALIDSLELPIYAELPKQFGTAGT
jgi:hypothetical protein